MIQIQHRKRQAAAAFAAVLHEEESEEEENDPGDEFVVVAASVAVFRRKRVCAEDYFRQLSPDWWWRTFGARLSRGTVELIVQQLGTLPGFVQAGDCPGRERVPVEKQRLVAIWLLGNQETFRSVCDRFDLARSTTHVIFKKVCNALCSELLFHASDRMFKTREKRQTRKNAQKKSSSPYLCTALTLYIREAQK